MSCTCNGGGHSSTCDASNEPLASALNNFVTSFFGSLTKTCVNNQVAWVLPCNLDKGVAGFPRNSGEGLACYFLRFIQTFNTELAAFNISLAFAVGRKGYRLTVLNATDVVLFRNVDVVNQDFTGFLVIPVAITLSSNGAVNGDEFYISFSNVVVNPGTSLSIRSDAVDILVLSTVGTMNGYLKAVYTGLTWKLTDTLVNIT